MNSHAKKKNIIHTLFFLNIIISTIITFYFIIFSLNKGFNLSDESYYILSFTQANKKLFELSHFGYILGSIYHSLSNNLIAFRVFGIVLLLCVCLLFSWSVNNYFAKTQRPFSTLTLFSISFSSIYYYCWIWLFTPSYNWLNLISILIVNIGLFNYFKKEQDSELNKIKLYGLSTLVGFGGALTFINKAPSAILLAISSLIWIFYHRNNKYAFLKPLSFLLLSALTTIGFIILHAYIYFGSLSAFIEDILRALNAASILGINHNITMVFIRSITDLSSALNHKNTYMVCLAILCLLMLYFLSLSFFKKIHQIKLKAIFIELLFLLSLGVFVAAIISIYAADIFPTIHYPRLTIDLGFAYIFFIFILLFSYLSIQIINKKNLFILTLKKDNKLFVAFFLIFMSFSYAIGTNNYFVSQTTGAIIFLVTSIFILISNIEHIQKKHHYRFIFSVINSIIIMLASYHGYLNPYRLGGNIKAQHFSVNFINSNYNILVDKSTKKYIETLKKSAITFGWTPGTTLIDLTRYSLGALVILDASIPGAAWPSAPILNPTVKLNSPAYLDKILNKIPKHLTRKAWILTTGNNYLANEAYSIKKLNFPEKYILVSHLKSPFESEEQILWRPKK